MTKEQANKIVEELYNESAYNVEVHPYCGEFSVQISEKCMYKTSMYINAQIVDAAHKHGCGMTIQTIGGGQEYVRIVLM